MAARRMTGGHQRRRDAGRLRRGCVAAWRPGTPMPGAETHRTAQRGLAQQGLAQRSSVAPAAPQSSARRWLPFGWRALLAGVLLVALAAGIGLPARAQATSPAHIVDLLYQHYIDTASGLVVSFDYTDPVVASNYFDATLAHLLVADAKDGAPRLDYDPFVDGQDFDIKKVDLETRVLADDAAEVTARFKNFDEDETRIYTVVRTKRGWRIADVRGEDEEPSLRDFLSATH